MMRKRSSRWRWSTGRCRGRRERSIRELGDLVGNVVVKQRRVVEDPRRPGTRLPVRPADRGHYRVGCRIVQPSLPAVTSSGRSGWRKSWQESVCLTTHSHQLREITIYGEPRHGPPSRVAPRGGFGYRQWPVVGACLSNIATCHFRAADEAHRGAEPAWNLYSRSAILDRQIPGPSAAGVTRNTELRRNHPACSGLL
jgi:hypothetical protein